MIRLKELFRLENLKRLRLVAGQEGIERMVTAAVLLEYDSSRMELPDFYRGDLVVTTLAYARGDSMLVANSLLALLNQGIAGLLVKTAYFSELPQSVVSMADKLGTPLFLFDETYIEEVILEVTELIRGKRHFAGYEQELDALMRGDMPPEQVKEQYLAQGYSAVCYTDHEVLVGHEDLCDEHFNALHGYEVAIKQDMSKNTGAVMPV